VRSKVQGVEESPYLFTLHALRPPDVSRSLYVLHLTIHSFYFFAGSPAVI